MAYNLGSTGGGPIAQDDNYYYVAHYSQSNVIRVAKATGAINVIASGSPFAVAPHGIAVDATTVYWSNYSGNTIYAVTK